MNFERYEKKDLTVILNENEVKGGMIREFLMKGDINRHKTLKLRIETAEEDEGAYKELNQIKDCKIEICMDKNNGNEKTEKVIVFSGYIKRSRYISYGSRGRQFEAEAYSKSEKMDREEKYRVFQDIRMTFRQVAEELLKDYKNERINMLFSEEAEISINELTVQFGETDWEFLLRLASHKGLGILSVHGGTLTFGFVNAGIAKNEDMKYTDYEMIREDEQMIYKIY